MKNIPQIRLFCTFSCCLVTSAHAELQLAAISADDFLGDMPVVLSATRLSQPLRDVPEAMTVLDRRTIEASGAQTIPDVLRLVPGFQIGQVNGSRVTATYHGFSDRFARDMEVLVDGRSVYDAGYGLVAWADLPLALEDIERIEVMRGPNAAAHGANAFSATINIITRQPFEQQGVFTNITRGNPDSNKVLMRYAAVNNDFEYRVTARYDDNRGIETRYDDSRTRMVNFRGDYQMDTRDSLFMALGASVGERDDGFGKVPTDDNFDVFQPERTVEDDNSFQQLRWTRSLSVDNEYSIQLYHNHQHIKDDFETILFSEYNAGLPPAIDLLFFGQPDQRLVLGYGFESERYDLEFQHKLRLSDAIRLAWGIGARVDSSSDLASYGSDETFSRNQSRLFINAEWFALPQLVFNAGTMVEKVEGTSTQWMPRLAANYHINNHHTLRFSVADAIRIPTLLEDHANVAAHFQDGAIFDYVNSGPGDLQPEELRSVELGYIASFPQLGLSWDLKFFRDRIKNRIVNPKDKTCLEQAGADDSVLGNVCDFFDDQGVTGYRGAFITGNYSSAEIEGYEIGLDWNLTERTWLRAAYAYADGITEEPRIVNPLELRTVDNYVPDLTYSLLVGHQFAQNLQLSAAYYHMAEMNWAGEGNKIPAYHRLDMRLAKSFKLADVSGKLALVMQNMQDEYVDFQDENIMRKRTYVSLDLFFR